MLILLLTVTLNGRFLMHSLDPRVIMIAVIYQTDFLVTELRDASKMQSTVGRTI